MGNEKQTKCDNKLGYILRRALANTMKMILKMEFSRFEYNPSIFGIAVHTLNH